MALYTGLRKGSLLALTVKNTDIATGTITLERTKNTHPLVLPLVGEALTLARELVEKSKDEYLFPRGTGYPWYFYRRAWENAVKRGGLSDVSFHTLRHCVGSYLVQAGIPLYVVSQILAHTKITTTQIYSHLYLDQLKDALETLSQRLSQ
jgi:integrase